MYLKALSTSKTGNSIVQKRDIDEIFINSYNVEWLRAWNGNMDIQVVLDYFAVITYVTDYYAKDDTGSDKSCIDTNRYKRPQGKDETSG